jgi:hypothetical protein
LNTTTTTTTTTETKTAPILLEQWQQQEIESWNSSEELFESAN